MKKSGNGGIGGFEPIEYKPRSKWEVKETVDAFLASDETCVGKDFGDDSTTAYESFRHYVRNHKVPVRVFRRKNVVGLIKDGE